MKAEESPLAEHEGAQLLALARHSLETFVRTGGRAELPDEIPDALQDGLGAFVTLHTRDGRLRGCIGSMVGHGPVIETVREMAIAAGTADPRFRPVSEAELADLAYEISVLSPMRMAQPEEVVPGRHGVYMRLGSASGVLLPQVAAEYGWDRETFLDHVCMKAGLQGGCWRGKACTLYTFTAQIFSE